MGDQQRDTGEARAVKRENKRRMAQRDRHIEKDMENKIMAWRERHIDKSRRNG